MKSNALLKVVVVDDESLVSLLIERELVSLGMDVVGKAPDGRQAIAMVRRLRPDVVVMDLAMPEMDGIAAAVAIQAECPTPVVILSAHESEEDVSLAIAAGVGAFLAKPPQAAELVRAINIAVARHSDLMELRRANSDLQKALADVKTLRGLLPICCYCKKIRDDDGYWKQVEVYFTQHSDAAFSHGFCPECMEKHFPNLGPSS